MTLQLTFNKCRRRSRLNLSDATFENSKLNALGVGVGVDELEIDRAQSVGNDSDSRLRTRQSGADRMNRGDERNQTRSDASVVRDAEADQRDQDADARDAAAQARDEQAALLDAEILAPKVSASRGVRRMVMGIVFRTAAEKAQADVRRRAAEQRNTAATDRAMAGEDRCRAADDRLAAAEELTEEGMDHLTGTLRRRVGMAAMQREIDRAARTGEDLVVAFVDVDGLKAVNDSLGHVAGDELLRVIAQCVRAGLRPYDVVMRYGGDELVCLMAGDGITGIRERFDEIAARIAKCHDSASVTVGLAAREAGEPLRVLIDRADIAMLAMREPS